MFQVEEFPDIWADACLRDSEGHLLFLSLYGRDGSLMQILAAIELGRQSQQGVDTLHLKTADGERHTVYIPDTKRLDKHSGRLPRGNLFGQLNQTWLFDKRLVKPDRVNRIGWVLRHAAVDGRAASMRSDERVWQLINMLSPVALRDAWRGSILTWLQNHEALTVLDSTLYPALGPIQGVRVSLSDYFTEFISEEVRAHRMRLDDEPAEAVDSAAQAASRVGQQSTADATHIAIAA